MLVVAVVLAVVGALFIALGSALQEQVVVGMRFLGGRGVRWLLRLVRQPRWLFGAACAGLGVGLHVLALSRGPVSIIQPVGTTGLLFALGVKAVLERRRLGRAETLGGTAVVLGLAGLLFALPHDTKAPNLTTPTATLLAGITLLASGLAVTVAWAVSSRSARAAALAFAAGTTFGVASALVSVIGHRMLSDLTAIASWPTLLVVVLLSTGGLAQQHAYRMRRFALAFAMLEIADPVSAATVGVLVLGEPLPSTPPAAAWMGLSAVGIVVGVVVLARSYLGPAPGHSDHARVDSDRHLSP
ncbi:DMT family transporter [Saccharomonospora sp. NB11]|uniref:DMT family transporter n=1 Tax=Saccharomonospora sp. NB11 TaxID=1642298 RepID=UPI0018D1339C|nr:DMT family transporter [Saccharomonospora sp. NB11]